MSGLDLAKTDLKLAECASIFENVRCECTLQAVEDIVNAKFQGSHAVFVAWQIQSIIWGKFIGGKLMLRGNVSPDVEYWLECRIFNEDAELHLKRIDNELRGRYVEDTNGSGNFYVDSFSRFWGEKSSASDGYINLLDRQRKLYMEIPCEDATAEWYGLLTRNYIASDTDTGLSGYVDYRFVSVEPARR